jgi:predicted dehydrogenase
MGDRDNMAPSSLPVAVKTAAPENSRHGLVVAIVGCGYWGSKHVRVLSGIGGVRQIAIVDPRPDVLAKIHADFRSALTFSDLASALPFVDAVVIATPPLSHFDLALAALREGKHVLVEKPLARSINESQLLFDEARRSDRLLMVGHTFLHNPAVKELRHRVAAGELGTIYYIHSARLNLGLYRSDVNVVWDLAPHDISIMNYLLQSLPTAVSAWGATLACGPFEDVAYVRLDYRDVGVSGFCHLSWLDPRKLRTVTVVGHEKMAVYDDLADERLRIFDCGVNGSHGDTPLYDRPISYRYGDIVSPHIRSEEPLAVEDQYFVDSIVTGKGRTSAGLNGMAIVAILEAIDRSLRELKTVEVEYPYCVNQNSYAQHHWIGS